MLLFAIGYVQASGAPSGSVAAKPLERALAPQPAVQPGQSATQLPDGRWLLLGGAGSDGAPTAGARIVDLPPDRVTTLTEKMGLARSGHSATLLPDGKVLIFGGNDTTGSASGTAEQFDPASGHFQALGELGLIARAGHAATVLANGHLLISGGVDQQQHAVYKTEEYNPATRQTENASSKLDTARSHHVAALLPTADVLLWGGVDSDGKALDSGELYKSASQSVNAVDAAIAAELGKLFDVAGTPTIESSQPGAEGQATPVDQALMVRFSQRMSVTTLSTATVTLIGPQGAVPIKAIPLEYGVLLFVTPQQDLLPASRYTLFIKGAKNVAGDALAFTAIGFDTAQLGVQGKQSAPSAEAAADPLHAGNPAAPTEHLMSAPPAQTALPATPGAAEQHAIAAAASSTDLEAWIPDPSNFRGTWRSNRGISPLQTLQQLQAGAGDTALTGQVLTLNGQALANVTLTIGAQSALSDATGRFLLGNLEAGARILTIDGQTANRNGARYGVYQTRVDIAPNRTNDLGYTIWSPMLDAAGDVALSAPTTQETVVTSPRIPGLELHIPAGTVIRDRNGKVITDINLTAIPTDRPPFPIPGVGVPVYFTIQPGGATLTSMNGKAQQGARLIYPNFSGAAPGTRIDFWNYDARGKGWYVYGQGTVTPTGKQVIPDAGVAIYEFTGAMISLPSNAPPDGPPPGACGGTAGDPVDCFTGLFLHEASDLVVDDILPLSVQRTYRPRDSASRAFGIGTNLAYDFFLVGDTNPWTYQELILPDGGRVHYQRTSAGTGYSDAVYAHTSTPSPYFGSTIRRGTGASCYWELALQDGGRLCFPESMNSSNARRAAATSISDRYGNTLTFQRDVNSNLTRATSPGGRTIDLTYDAGNRIIQASDNGGRSVNYQYDTAGHLTKATDPAGQFQAYTYDASHNMLTVQDKRGNLMVTNAYDVNNRVSKQTYADGTTNLFAYALGTNGKVTQTDITNERGVISRMQFNASGYTSSVTHAFGRPEQQVVTTERDPATNLVLARTDALGRKTIYTYDAKGNQLTRTTLAGTPDAATVSMTYTADFNQLASMTDVMGHKWTMTYDAQGNLVQRQDPNGNRTTQRFNGAGQPIQVSNALGMSVNLDYAGSDLAQITDPLSRSTTFFTDGIGRQRSATDALGNRTSVEMDALSRPTQVTDPLNQTTAGAYDANGNQTRMTDAKGNLHQFVFDKRNAPTGAVNPLNQTESYLYDGAHNLTQKTDQKGQITRYAYDTLDRMTNTTYADASTVTYTYDQGNRITRIVDAVNGAIAFTYDSHDWLLSTTTPKGSVAYTYYANGLRKSMSVPSQPQLTYTYDAGNRLTRIDQAAGAANNYTAQGIALTYDAADRRIQTRYMNGVTRDDSYDAAGQLTAITYKKPDGTIVGDLAYSYDKGGRRTGVSGSLARTSLPSAVTSAGVDAANRLTVIGAQALSYDTNGNLIGDGNQTYVWNARNQLVQIKNGSGAIIAAFTYDALGRRQTKTVNGVSSGFVYDGANIVQELAGTGGDNSNPSNVRASYISGGIDEVFAQLSGTGTSSKTLTYLNDALGSTVRLVDSKASKVVDYTYDPYGNTAADAAINNPFQYTGRENDGNGLYYYRSRYYSTTLARFISNDLIGLGGGINTYGYVGGNPISYTDPYGLWRFPDYVSIGVPIFGPVGVSLTIDRAGNVYGGLGIGASLRGGVGFGIGWTGDQCTPNSKQLDNFIGGWGGNAGVGLGVTWASPQNPGNGDPNRIGLSLQTPGLGIGYNWNLGNLGNL